MAQSYEKQLEIMNIPNFPFQEKIERWTVPWGSKAQIVIIGLISDSSMPNNTYAGPIAFCSNILDAKRIEKIIISHGVSKIFVEICCVTENYDYKIPPCRRTISVEEYVTELTSKDGYAI
jgi:hypothetical protein